MEYHGWELALLCLVRTYEVSVWPVAAVAAVWVFRDQVRDGIKALMKKVEEVEELIELKVAGGSAKFRPQKVRLPPLQGVEEKP
jgi:hypothetical protein